MRTDTIAAIATAHQTGGVAIIRISGTRALEIANTVFQGKTPPSETTPYLLQYGRISFGGSLIDKGMCVVMRAPHSFTGEDVAELHIHGGVCLAETVLAAVLDSGAVLAQPGEFTRRAFLNGKLDLAEAEALGDLIAGESALSLYAAANQLSGRLSNKINALRDGIIELTAELAVAADYPEEDIEYLQGDAFSTRLRALLSEVDALVASAKDGRIIREGLQCAIVGRPNTGKSSLLNALVGERRAIVTAAAGTTRDIVEDVVQMDGIAVKFGDTAGIRADVGEAEAIGIEMAKAYVEQADVCLVVLDGTDVCNADAEILSLAAQKPHIIVLNKTDLHVYAGEFDAPTVHISALTGEGLDDLKREILKLAADADITNAEKIRITNMRHRDAAVKAQAALRLALQTVEQGFPSDLASPDLEEAAAALGEIVGVTVSEEIIDRIFEKFCLGK